MQHHHSKSFSLKKSPNKLLLKVPSNILRKKTFDSFTSLAKVYLYYLTRLQIFIYTSFTFTPVLHLQSYTKFIFNVINC